MLSGFIWQDDCEHRSPPPPSPSLPLSLESLMETSQTSGQDFGLYEGRLLWIAFERTLTNWP